MPIQPDPFQNNLLYSSLTELFGDFDDTVLSTITPLLEGIEIQGGDCLFRQDDPGDSLYFVMSGRLQALVTEGGGEFRKIGEIIRGETVGETALITGDPRNASIFALRDSSLVRLSKKAFEEVIAHHPAVALNMAKRIIYRLKNTPLPGKSHKKPVTICLLALHSTIDLAGMARNLNELLRSKGSVYLMSGDRMNEFSDQANERPDREADPAPFRTLSRWLDHLESQYEFLLLVADPPEPTGLLTEWSQFCLHQADDIVQFADAQQASDLTPPEIQLHHKGLITGQVETLVLVHQADTLIPRQTAGWLSKRPRIRAHYHIRAGSDRDLARLSRILSNTAIGLVLAGGGARGFAHVGVLKALQEHGIPVDFVGGTSVGGLIASAVSFDQPAEIVRKHARKGAFFNPTKDYNWLPMISLIRGQRMERMIRDTVTEFLNDHEPDLEDSWLTLFVVSSNYTQARAEVHTRGSLVKYLKATTAIPGVFPPVIDGDDFLIDGGTFNNFPADVMRQMPVGRIIGIDLVVEKSRKLTISSIPGPAKLLRDRFRPKKLRKFRLPSLASIILNSTLLYSSSQRSQIRQYVDLYFNPDVSRFGLMEWSAFDKIVQKGYEHAMIVLKSRSADEQAMFRGEPSEER
ncbi:cyclic nucleotide-binding and patatin-like phospholipase domain-containing protein [Larkinella humicola]|uniref:Cyclic nucleotide-binding domain-containing protein n=1 Tax=Larkinella humicola TaxID=2607654 RepID=A0A5N1J7U3_9BACT|nr:cyclic nucleotide-binding and patatin-like phospholipase domain-containing protein [Larkinella humicola]KAA9347031.1 cyclic nucleotide-binding domain-containing protein [Larkinella humicola]